MTGKNEIVDLATRIKAADIGSVMEERLSTSDRVLRRVTDGIYRRPASALRELISNAYDADATVVTIETDSPRFSKIVIRDNGNGMTHLALSSMIKSIGGSVKRTELGVEMQVVSPEDTTKSPGGRKLIGKIGIGLFSVSQLTREFQIITKTAGDKFRTISDVVLETYTEDRLRTVKGQPEEQVFRTGHVKIWKIPASDIDSHGTEIILRNLHKKVRDDLGSREMWESIAVSQTDDDMVTINPPNYHIGCIYGDLENEIKEKPRLPWLPSDSPEERFQKLVECMYQEFKLSEPNPSLDKVFDNYLHMLWLLGLSIPIQYMEKHPFDLAAEDGIRIFSVGNTKKSKAEEVTLLPGETVRSKFGLVSPIKKAGDSFEVFIDGIKILRPLRFSKFVETQHAVDKPLMFIGKDSPDLAKIPEDIRGGENLSFEGYLLWMPKVVPTDHIGVLIRVNDASGTLFDETFMKYQVSELTRKNQISAEIFVNEGLDAALNIDRESFNFSHPHYQIITTWVHNAFKQFATKHKAIAGKIRADKRASIIEEAASKIDKYSLERLLSLPEAKKFTTPPRYEITSLSKIEQIRSDNITVFSAEKLYEHDISKKPYKQKVESTVKALTRLLETFGLLEEIDYEQQEKLLREILSILIYAEENS